MALSLKNKVVLVTGSSAGLGKSMAITLGAAGAKVCVNYFNRQARAEETFQEFKSRGSDGILVRANVTDENGVDSLFETIEKQLGPVDILVINATCAQPQMPIEDYSWGHFQEMLEFFVKSPYLLVRRALPSMKARLAGRIINIGSEVFQRGVPNFTAYVSAKGAQAGFSRSLAQELAPWNITVNLVAPGWIPVERHESEPEEAKAAYKCLIPMGRWGVPQDVADAVLYLASDASGFITGQTLAVNGGMTVS